jgi:hypothetical protein
MPRFPTTPDETRRWLKVSERNFESDARAWWVDQPTQRRGAISSIEEFDSEHLSLSPRDVDIVVRFLSTPSTAEGQVLVNELLVMSAPDQARWFLQEINERRPVKEDVVAEESTPRKTWSSKRGIQRTSISRLDRRSSSDRVRAHRAGKWLREEFGES